MLHVDQIIREMENGCTKPYLAKLSDGERIIYAVIKLKDNDQGVLTLINELISYYLAKELDVLIPLSGIAVIDEYTDFGAFKVNSSSFGNCFFSEYIDKSTIINNKIMRYVSNTDSYEKILLFDHLIYNKDRNKGNLLIYFGKGDKLLYIIDHTHVFKNQTIWDQNCLRQGMIENDFKDLEILNENRYEFFFTSKKITYESLLGQAKIFKERINETLLNEIFKKILGIG